MFNFSMSGLLPSMVGENVLIRGWGCLRIVKVIILEKVVCCLESHVT